MHTPFLAASAASAIFTIYQFSQLISIQKQGHAAKAALLREAKALYTEFNRLGYSGQNLPITKVTDKFSEQNLMRMINPVLKGVKDQAETLNFYINTAYDGISEFLQSPSNPGAVALQKNIPSKETLLQYIEPMQKMGEAGYTYIAGGAAATAIFAGLSYDAKDSDSKGLAGTQDED